jgi:hypothetical protein
MARFVRVQSIRHPLGATGRFDLKVTSADVRVRATDGSDMSLRATFEIRAESEQEADEIFQRVQLITEAGTGRLVVEEPDGPPSMRGMLDRLLRGRGTVDLSVEAEVPPAAELRLEAVSGDVTVEGLHGAQRYTTVSGDLYVTGAGGSLRVNTVSGDVTLRGERPIALRSEAVSGDLSVAVPRIDDLRTQTVSGDIEVEGELAPTGEFRAETVSGDVTVGLLGGATFEVRGISTDISSDLDHRIEGRLDRRRVVIGSGRPTFVFNSMSGDLSIHRPRRVTPMAPGVQPPAPPAAPRTLDESEQLAVLQALERGEIDVDEATRRLGGGDA